jgi:hypothetical protein
VNIQSSANSICVGDTLTLTAVGGGTYNWSPAGSLSASSGSVVQAFLTSTTTYTVNASNSGCQVQNIKTITVHQLPSVSLSGLNSICENSNPVILSGGSPTGGVYSGTGVVSGSFNPALAGYGVIPVSYFYTDGGCSDSATGSMLFSETCCKSFTHEFSL